MARSRLVLKVSLELSLIRSNPNTGPETQCLNPTNRNYVNCTIPMVVVGGKVVRLEFSKASLATFAATLLSSLSSSISQMEGQTLKMYPCSGVANKNEKLTLPSTETHLDRRTSTPVSLLLLV